MGYKKQLLWSFFYLWAAVSDSTNGLESKQLNKYKKIDLNTNIESECICLENSLNQENMPQLLDPMKKGLERLIIFLYRDYSGTIQIYIPGLDRQAIIPDLQIESRDLAVPVTRNITFESLFQYKDRVLNIHPFFKDLNDPNIVNINTNTNPSIETTTETESKANENVPQNIDELQTTTESYVNSLVDSGNIDNSTNCCDNELSDSNAKETSTLVPKYILPIVKGHKNQKIKIKTKTKTKIKIKGSSTKIYDNNFPDKNEIIPFNKDIIDQLIGKDKIELVVPINNKHEPKQSEFIPYKPIYDKKKNILPIIYEPFYKPNSAHIPKPNEKENKLPLINEPFNNPNIYYLPKANGKKYKEPIIYEPFYYTAYTPKPGFKPHAFVPTQATLPKGYNEESLFEQPNYPNPKLTDQLPVKDYDEKVLNGPLSEINTPIPINTYDDLTPDQISKITTPHVIDDFYKEVPKDQDKYFHPKEEDYKEISPFDPSNSTGTNKKPKIPNGKLQFSAEEIYQVPDENNENDQENLIKKLIHAQHSHVETNPMISDLTFSQWFATQMKNMESKTSFLDRPIDIYTLEILIKKSLMEHGLYVSSNGKLIDSKGQLLNMSNLHIRPLLIGQTLEYDKLVTSQHTNFVLPRNLPYLESLLITLLYPPKIIGIIPMGKFYLPNVKVQSVLSDIIVPNLSFPQSIKYVIPKTETKHVEISLIKKGSRKSKINLNSGARKNKEGKLMNFDRDAEDISKINTDEHGKESSLEREGTNDKQSIFESIELNSPRLDQEYSEQDLDDPNEINSSRESNSVTEPLETSTEPEKIEFEDEKDNNALEKNEILQRDTTVKENEIVEKDTVANLSPKKSPKRGTKKNKELTKTSKADIKQRLDDLKVVKKKLRQMMKLLRRKKPLSPKNEEEEDLDTFDPTYRIIGGAAATGSGSPISSRGRSGLPRAF